MLKDFLNYIDNCVKKFKDLEKQTIRVIGHHDSDGLCATSILTKSFERGGYNFCVSVVKQLKEELIKEIANEGYKIIFFLDLGSGSIEQISKILKEKKVFILDHHGTNCIEYENIFNINPLLFGVDSGKDISGAGVTYLFCKTLDPRNKDAAYVALIGAIGDVQEDKGFVGINSEIILKDAIESETIEVKTGLTFFGANSKPLHKLLEYSTSPYIPGVSGSEIGAIKFLNDLNISYKDGEKFRKITNLNQDETKRLVTGIIMLRVGSVEKPDDVLGPIYSLKNEDGESLLKDLKEFSTLLNACGRLGKYSLGIGTCLGLSNSKKDAINVLKEYKNELMTGLNWFYKSRGSEKIIESSKYIILNSGDDIKETLIGTVLSIISKSNLYKSGYILIGMAYTIDGAIKVSLRVVGNTSGIDLQSISSKLVSRFEYGLSGGHKEAAGALIQRKDEKAFINACKEVLEEVVLEDKI